MRLRVALTALMFMVACAGSAPAAEYPDQPVKVVAPFPAGGFLDVVARIASQRLSESLGKPLVVENRPGAGGKIGEDFVKNSKADGYTLLIDIITRPTLVQAVDAAEPETIDIEKSFVTIGPIGSSPMILNASPSIGVKDFASFAQKLKSEPGKYTYASAGVGTPSHIVSAQLVRELGVKVVHAPYRGGAPALQDVTAGVVAWMVDTPSGSMPLIQGDKVVPLFVVNPNRVKSLPQLPTLGELGHPSFQNEVMSIYLLAPAALPDPVARRLSAALIELQGDGAVRSRLENISIEPVPPSDLAASRA